MKGTITLTGSIIGAIVAIIGYILAIIRTIKNKQNNSSIDWNLFLNLNIASLVGFLIIVISIIVSSP